MIHYDELDLLAVRYVTGEMDAAEVSAFEVRLAEEQAAREAVEFAVRIAAVSTEEVPVSVVSSSPERSWGGLAAAALLVCAGAAFYFFGDNAAAPGDGSAGTGSQASAALSRAAQEEDQILIASWMAFGDLSDEGSEDIETAEDLSELVVDLGVVEPPDWMMQGLMK